MSDDDVVALLDDELVLRALLGQVATDAPRLATTTTWWWRLAEAVRRGRGGQLSGLLAGVGELEAEALTDAIDRLDKVVTVLDLRSLLGLATDLAAHHGLNLLTAEAAAAALTLGAEIVVATDNPNLRRVSHHHAINYRVRPR